MADLNEVRLIGRLSQDPVLKDTKAGTICNFCIVVNRTWKDKTGALQKTATFINCEAWGIQGENLAKYCKKGSQIFFGGRVQIDQWTDQSTQQKRTMIKFVAENIQYLDNRSQNQNQNQPSQQKTQEREPVGAGVTEYPVEEYGDVPF